MFGECLCGWRMCVFGMCVPVCGVGAHLHESTQRMGEYLRCPPVLLFALLFRHCLLVNLKAPVSARVAGRQAPRQDLPALLPSTWASGVCSHAQLSQECWGFEHRSLALTVSALTCGGTIAFAHTLLSKCFGDIVWRKSLISCSTLNTQMVQIAQGFEISHSKMLSPLCWDAFCLVK